MNSDDFLKDAKTICLHFGTEGFVCLLQIALWIAKSCEKHDLEIAYMDDELITFKHKKTLTERLKLAKEQ